MMEIDFMPATDKVFNSNDSITVILSCRDYQGIDLSYRSIKEGQLSFVCLSAANLKNTDLQGANLSYANLSHTNLENADMRNTLLKGANFSNANLQGTVLKYAEFDSQTQLPFGYEEALEKGMKYIEDELSSVY